MAMNRNADYVGLKALLEQYDIDPNRVREKGMDASGYDYVKQYRDGRPQYEAGQLKLALERREWPSKEVWQQVEKLYYGLEPRVEPTVKAVITPELQASMDADTAALKAATAKVAPKTPAKKD